jgi:isocitrate dehydrogenase
MSEYTHARVPDHGDCTSIDPTTTDDGMLRVPERPNMPLIEGDGIGRAIVAGM